MPLRPLLLSTTLCALAGLGAAETRTWTFDAGSDGWTVWGTGPGADGSGVVSHAASGGHAGGCLAVRDASASHNHYAVLNPPLAAKPGSTWHLTAWVRCERADQPAPALAVAAESADPAKPFNTWLARTVIKPSTTWTRVELAVPALPANAGLLRPALFPVGDAGPVASGQVWLDDVRLSPQEVRPLDLAPAFNRGLRDDTPDDGLGGWTDQGENDMRGLKPGPLAIGGVTFTIADPAAHQGKAVVALSADRRGFAKTAEIAVGASCDRLLLLHAAAWSSGRVGTVAWLYADGTSAESPVRSGQEVADWWTGVAELAASRALRGANPTHDPVYLFASAIANPQPGRSVRAVELRAGDGKAIWLVLAAQASCGGDPLASAKASERDRSAWPAFAPVPAMPAKPLVDLSGLLDAPAGKHGFVRSQDGHFLLPDGRRLRFWGTNIHSNMAIFPSHQQAERVAATLARYGFNLVRLHLPDSSIIDPTRPDRQTFIGDDQLERFDYLVKCLIGRGIYLVIDGVAGMSGRKLGVVDGILAGYSSHRPGDYFVPRLREHAYDFSRRYLTRRNLHTGRALVDEPGVAFVTMHNEQSVFFDWGAAKAGMPEAYRQLLEQEFAAWLRQKHGDRAALAAAWGGELAAGDDPAAAVALAPLPDLGIGVKSGLVGGHGPQRKEATVAFLQALQERADASFTQHLRTLGLKVPINGTNLTFSPAELYAQRVNDLTSHNAYFDHVSQLGDGKLGFRNRPQPLLDLLAGERELETHIAAAHLAGRPVTSTETDTMFPQEWRASYGLATPATAALQDWDAVMHYCYMGGWGYTWDVAEQARGVLQPTVEFNDPALAGLFPAAAMIYLRGDVAPAKARVQVVYGDGERTSTRPLSGRGPFPFSYLTNVARVDSAFGAPTGAPAAVVGARPAGTPGAGWSEGDPVAAVRALDAELKKAGVIPADRGLQGQALVSDTGELRKDWGRGVISIDSPRSQGVTGFPGAAGVRLRDVAITMPKGGFATVIASSLDGAPIATSRKLLLTTVGRAENDGMEVSYGEMVKAPDGSAIGERMVVKRTSPPGQVRIEPVQVRIELPGRSATVTPLAGDLQASGAPRAAVPAGAGRLTVTLGEAPQSVWYVVEVAH